MKPDIQPTIEPDDSWHQDLGAVPSLESDSFSVPEVHMGSRPVVREVLETIALTLLVFLGLRLVVQNFMVEGTSMEPTLHGGQGLLVNKAAYYQWDSNFFARLIPFQEGDSSEAAWAYLLGGPQRGDIIVFHAPAAALQQQGRAGSEDFVKRIIGLPGDKVEVRANDGVYVNGQKLAEPYIAELANYDYPGAGQSPSQLLPDEIFVLGDNRRVSDDSHVFGPIKINSVVGKAWFTYWPSTQIGPLPHPAYSAP